MHPSPLLKFTVYRRCDLIRKSRDKARAVCPLPLPITPLPRLKAPPLPGSEGPTST